MTVEVQVSTARRFLRMLNVALKAVRMYGLGHQRSREQCDLAWAELEKAVLESSPEGLLLGVAGGQLLVNGEKVEASLAERGFAQSLTAAGVASLEFSSQATREDFQKFVDVLATAGPKSGPVSEQLGSALAGTGIRMNQFRYVAEDASRPQHHETDELTGVTTSRGAGSTGRGEGNAGVSGSGGISGTFSETLLGLVAGKSAGEGSGQNLGSAFWNDPVKWLQMLASSDTGGGAARGTVGGESGAGTAEAHDAAPLTTETLLKDEEVIGLLQVLGKLGRASASSAGGAGTVAISVEVNREISGIPPAARVSLQQALLALSQSGPRRASDSHLLVELAEHLAIRHALNQFQRGDVQVSNVRGMLARMGEEVRNLRQLLGLHEGKMRKAGLAFESAADLLDQQFWAAVPESGKRSVLLSADAWCIPAMNVRQYVQELRGRGEVKLAGEILQAYAACVRSTDGEVRKKTASGLRELAEVYTHEAPSRQDLAFALKQLGEQLSREQEAEARTALSATFLKLGKLAIERRSYVAVMQVAVVLDAIHDRVPLVAKDLKPRLGLENRVADFIEHVLTAPKPDPFRDEPLITDALVALLERMQDVATDVLAARMPRCVRVEERERLVELTGRLGPKTLDRLKEKFATKPATEGIDAAGLLSRMEPALVVEQPQKIRTLPLATQWTLIQQIVVAGASESADLLAGLLENVDVRLRSVVVEEIGLAAAAEARGAVESLVARLLSLAGGDKESAGRALVQLKAIEALGRLRAPAAVALLKKLVETKQVWRWQHPHELRLVAAQALAKIDPAWTRRALSSNDLNDEEFRLGPLDMPSGSAWTRNRRYRRVALDRPLWGAVVTPNGDVAVEVKSLSLGGGQAECKQTLPPGLDADLVMKPGRVLGLPIPVGSIQSKILLRYRRPQLIGFDFIEMDFEDRWKLRRLLVGLLPKVS